MFGDEEHQELAREAFPLLIEKAKTRDTIRYGDLAREFGIPSNGYPMSQMLGSIMTTLYELDQKWQDGIPHLTTLVVRASTGYPSYPSKTSNEVFDREFKRIYKYRKWDAVQNTLLPPADSLLKLELHPVISQKVLPIFEREIYGLAVFEAFKQVEVAVREAGSYAETDYGTKLMRMAFNPKDGALTDSQDTEKQARSDLFAGAIGSYKNPGSHRNVEITAEEATEVIIVASHLLRIVDSCNQSGL